MLKCRNSICIPLTQKEGKKKFVFQRLIKGWLVYVEAALDYVVRRVPLSISKVEEYSCTISEVEEYSCTISEVEYPCTISKVEEYPTCTISEVEEKPFMSSLNICQEVLCRKGWGMSALADC
jgi:hypothetical protein